jgi:hypothetical protein
LCCVVFFFICCVFLTFLLFSCCCWQSCSFINSFFSKRYNLIRITKRVYFFNLLFFIIAKLKQIRIRKKIFNLNCLQENTD